MNTFLSDSSKQTYYEKGKKRNENRCHQIQQKKHCSSKNFLDNKENIDINKMTNNFVTKKTKMNKGNNFNRKNNRIILNLKNNLNLNPKMKNKAVPIEIKQVNKHNNTNFVKKNDSTTNPSRQINSVQFTNNIINCCLIKENSNINQNFNISNPINKLKNKDILLCNSQKELSDNEIEKSYPLPESDPFKISKSINNTNNMINISTLNKDKKNTFNNSNKFYLNEISYISNNDNLEHYHKNEIDIDNSNNNYKLIIVLKNLNLSYLINTFSINSVRFNDLLLLTREDLIEMKVPIGPRNKLLHFIEEYKKLKKNLDIDELKFFVNNYNNNIPSYMQERISENNLFSTIATSNNEFSNRIKRKSFTNNLRLNDKKEEINKNDYYNNNICHEFTKENDNIKDIFSLNNNYLSNSSCSNRQTNTEKENMNIIPYINNNRINKKIFNSSIISKNNEDKNDIDIDNVKINISKYNRSSRNLKRNNQLRNPLIQLIEDSQTNRTYSAVNAPVVDGTNRDTINNKDKNAKTIINSHEFIKKNDKNNNIKKSKSIGLFKNDKKKHKHNCNDKIINNKIIENFKNLNYEVENFQKCYKRIQKDSYDRKNRIKCLLLEEKKSIRRINTMKQQIKNIEYSFKSKSLKNKKDRNLYINSNNIIPNYDSIKSNKNILMYEFNIENVK